MAKVVPLPVAPDASLAIPLFDGALLHCVPLRESPQVLLTVYGPRGGNAGGVVLHAERAAVLGRWLERLAARQRGIELPAEAALARAMAEPPPLVDPKAVCGTLAALAVPEFADWWTLDVIGRGQRVRRLAVGHADASRAEAARLLRKYPPDPRSVHPRSDVLRTGRPNVAQDVTDARLVAAARSTEHLTTMRSLGCRSSLLVPLIVRRRIVGVMTFVTAESGRRYDDRHVAGARAFATEAALALDNLARIRRAGAALRRARRVADTRSDGSGSR